MKYRKLRIAWSVGWGLLAVLLCVLWARSYRIVTAALFDRSPTLMLIDGAFIYGVDFMWDGRCKKTERTYQLTRNERMIVQNFVRGGRGIEMQRPGTTTKLWPLAGSSALAAGLPWMTLFKRFSLRTLLIGTTLVAVVLGVIVYIVRV